MKKIVTSAVMLGTAFTIGGFVQAANVTDGKIKFTEGTGPVTDELLLIKPGTEKEQIIVDKEQGSKSTGGIRFSFIPNLDFGNGQISIIEQTYYAKPLAYKGLKDEVNAPKKYLPPFVQVINESGLNKKFAVSVWATPFKTPEGNVLENSRIKLKDFQARNNVLDAEKNGQGNVNAVERGYLKVPNLTALPDQAFVIPTQAADAKPILDSVNGDLTLGTASSVVFQDNYTLGSDLTEKSEMKSVFLTVPPSDSPKKDKSYTSIITWDIIDAK